MQPDHDLNATIQITLRRDEAIVLQAYLARELEPAMSAGLAATIAHPAETLCLEGLMHELVPHLPDTGGPSGAAILEAAHAHLVARFR